MVKNKIWLITRRYFGCHATTGDTGVRTWSQLWLLHSWDHVRTRSVQMFFVKWLWCWSVFSRQPVALSNKSVGMETNHSSSSACRHSFTWNHCTMLLTVSVNNAFGLLRSAVITVINTARGLWSETLPLVPTSVLSSSSPPWLKHGHWHEWEIDFKAMYANESWEQAWLMDDCLID